MKQYFKNIIIKFFLWLGFEPINKIKVVENVETLEDPYSLPFTDRFKKQIPHILELNKKIDESYPFILPKTNDLMESVKKYNIAKDMELKFLKHREQFRDPILQKTMDDENSETKNILDEQRKFINRKLDKKYSPSYIRFNKHLKDKENKRELNLSQSCFFKPLSSEWNNYANISIDEIPTFPVTSPKLDDKIKDIAEKAKILMGKIEKNENN